MATRRNFILSMAAVPLAATLKPAWSQNRNPYTVVVPYKPGGSADTLGRIFANALSEQLNEPVVVENRAGASGTIGAGYVARSAPDGKTMLCTLGNLLLNQEFLLPEVPFRALEDLKPLAKTCDLKVAIVAAADHPANNLKEFIELAKRAPGKHTFAFYGDLGVVSMAEEAGIELLRIPYKGGTPGLIDVAAGLVDIIASSFTQAKPMLDSGKVKILAVMTGRSMFLRP